MEPQIVDFYNEMPSGVNVIDKLNEEYIDLLNDYNNLQNDNNKLKNELERIKTLKPIRIKVDTIENFIQKGQEIEDFIPKFKQIIYDFLKHEGWISELPEPCRDYGDIMTNAGLGYWDNFQKDLLFEWNNELHDSIYGIDNGNHRFNIYLKIKLIEELYNLFNIKSEERNKIGWFNHLIDEAFNEVEKIIITMLKNCHLPTNHYYDIIYKIIGVRLFGIYYDEYDMDKQFEYDDETFIQNIYYYECKKCKNIVDGQMYNIINDEAFSWFNCDCLC